MLDISEEIENLLKTIKLLAKDSEEYIKIHKPTSYLALPTASIENEIIDVSQINFSDDETWLCKAEGDSNITDIRAWLHEDTEALKDLDFHTKHLTLMREITKLDSAKKIDTRTFTRPKKRFSRPSLDLTDSRFKLSEFIQNGTDTVIESSVVPENNLDVGTPLNFNLSEPVNIFNNLTKGDAELDSFQNMSPPSLVSSSMFSSIMENSYIKNDPVLREIRDTDYTDVILQGCDPSILKSFTGSCSSIDSDTPEGFLKRSVETTFIKNDKNNCSSDTSINDGLNQTFTTDNTVVLNSTFQKEPTNRKLRSFAHSPKLNQEIELDSSNNVSRSRNKTSSILNNSYRNSSNKSFNGSFKVPTHNQNKNVKNVNLNETITISNNDNIDSNKLNYTKRRSCIIEDTKSNAKFNTFSKRNSIGCLLGSNDSLDFTSSLSNSSSGKGSSKMLNMAEVDAIVLQQEQSLQQVMSTPKPTAKYPNTLTECSNISPIRQVERPERFSDDSEASSNDDYLTVGSGSSKSITSGNSDTIIVAPPKKINIDKSRVLTGSVKNLDTLIKPVQNRNIHYGSYTNLHKAKIMAQQGSQKNLSAGTGAKTIQSNLKTLNTKLKGSYTQLKPVFTNLPPTTISNPKGFVAPTLRDQPKAVPVVGNTKVVGKASGLPRPVSAIPRPAGSRIPGPQRSGIALSRPTSKINVDTDF